MIISKDIKETKIIHLWDLLNDYVGEEPTELDILRVLDTAGNVVPKSDELEIVYEVTYTEDVDSTEMTPEQENEWLRGAGF
jgi:hypothetical protein